MQKKLVFFCLMHVLGHSALIEWISPEKYLTEPVCEEDSHKGLPHRVRYQLAKRGHVMVEKTWDQAGDGDLIVWLNIGKKRVFKRICLLDKKHILLQLESPIYEPFSLTPYVVKQFKHLFTWNDAIEKNEKIDKIYYPAKNVMANNLPSFEERALSAMILSNHRSSFPGELYSKRRELVSFYESLPNGEKSFHLYGKKWNKNKPVLKTYRGSPSDVTETLKGYRFAFTFENWSNDVGYITEKIFSAFTAGAVPIYLGASNISDYIPEDCYIDARKFASFEAIHHFLISMSKEDWIAYQQRIQLYLESKRATLFSPQSVALLVTNQILKTLSEQ